MVCQSVDFFMGLQIACLRECLVTLWTAEWFVNSVDFFMGLQIACLRECVMPHFGQLNGTSTVWIFSWVFRFLACANVSPHFGQLNGLSPVWICSWVFRLLSCAIEFPLFLTSWVQPMVSSHQLTPDWYAKIDSQCIWHKLIVKAQLEHNNSNGEVFSFIQN